MRVQGKIRAFLVLKYIQKHIQYIETTFMKMHTDTVEPPVLPSRQPLWQPRGRARGSRPAGPPATPRSSRLPVLAPKSLPSPKSGNITAAQGRKRASCSPNCRTGAKDANRSARTKRSAQARTFPHGAGEGQQSERNGRTV